MGCVPRAREGELARQRSDKVSLGRETLARRDAILVRVCPHCASRYSTYPSASRAPSGTPPSRFFRLGFYGRVDLGLADPGLQLLACMADIREGVRDGSAENALVTVRPSDELQGVGLKRGRCACSR